VDVSFLGWVALIAGLVSLLLVDLFVLHRGAHTVPVANALWSTLGFVAVAVAFGIGLGVFESHHVAGEFFAGYVLELSLSLDNVFVWALIFGAFSVPPAYQHRVLFYGIFGALVMRGAFVAAGAELLERFEWVVYVFGVLLIWSGVRLLRRHAGGDDGHDSRSGWVVRLLRRNLPTTEHIHEAHLFVRADRVPEAERPRGRRPLLGLWYATPMLAVLAVVEVTDVLFAVDSIPAIFGVTREPFIVFSATALALICLRSMYFLLAGMRGRFAYLDVGLAIILIGIGVKFLLEKVVHVPTGVSLLMIVVVLGGAMGASLWRERHG